MGRAGRQVEVWSPLSEERYAGNQIELARPENREILGSFAEWLKGVRRLAPATITDLVSHAREFVDALSTAAGMGGVAAQAWLTPLRVEELAVAHGRDHGVVWRRHRATAMRTWLVFAAEQGWVEDGLSQAVPGVVARRLSVLPRAFSRAEIEALWSASIESARCPLRDQAILALLISYGARRGQVSALCLTDIDWQDRTIDFVAHKGGKKVQHVLTPAVAEALARYLRCERPASESESVFLRQCRPHRRLSPQAITEMVRERLHRCGLEPRGPHGLRHAFASRLLAAGESMETIADMLGHRSLGAVAIYAKLEVGRLLECALEWPEVTA